MSDCRQTLRFIRRTTVSLTVLSPRAPACVHQIVLMVDWCSAGTASVIIALTDGELNDWQFDTARREVRRLEDNVTGTSVLP